VLSCVFGGDQKEWMKGDPEDGMHTYIYIHFLSRCCVYIIYVYIEYIWQIMYIEYYVAVVFSCMFGGDEKKWINGDP